MSYNKKIVMMSLCALSVLFISSLFVTPVSATSSARSSTPSSSTATSSQAGDVNRNAGSSGAHIGSIAHPNFPLMKPLVNSNLPSSPAKAAATNSSGTSPPPAVRVTTSLPSVKTPSHAVPSSKPLSTPIVDSKGNIVHPPYTQDHQWDIIYYSQQEVGSNGFIDFGETFVAPSNSIGNWQCGDFLCTGTPNSVLIIPLNIDLGTDPGDQTWFQFDIEFDQNCTVGICSNGINCFCIWENPNPTGYCGSSISYNANHIGISYNPGDTYEVHFYYTGVISGQQTFTFLIKDENTAAQWFKTFNVPGINLVYEGSCFSPSVAVETYISTATSSLNGVPFLQVYDGNDVCESYICTNTYIDGSVYAISCDFCYSSTGPLDGYSLGIYQSFLENDNSGLYWWDMFQAGSLVPVTLNLVADSSTSPINIYNDFPIYYAQNGCSYCYVVNYESDLTNNYYYGEYSPGSLTIAMDPNTYFELYTYSTASDSGGDLVYWCYVLNSGSCDAVYPYSYSGTSYTYYYYEIYLEEPYMNVIDGGSAPGVSLSYETVPTSATSTDSPLSTSVALSTSSSVIWVLPGTTMSVPTCDPSGLHYNGILFIPYCGTNYGAYPSERWDTDVCSSSILLVCYEYFTASHVNSLTNINYRHQYLTPASYFTSDGTNAPKNPTFKGTSFSASDNFPLTTSITYVWLDAGSSWSTLASIAVSSTERYHTTTASGSITSSANLAIEYLHQFYIVFDPNPIGAAAKLSASGWYNANTPDSITTKAASGYKFSSWTSSTLSITFGSTTSASTTMTPTAAGTVTANFIPSVKLTLNPTSGSVAHGSSITTMATIKGAPQSVTLSKSGLPKGVTVSFATNPITDSIGGVADTITIHTSSSTPAGTYTIKITATGADGQKSTATYTLTVT